MPQTSIIIVSYNGLQETTAPCLESIFAGGAQSDFEVIVVDNCSSDDTAAYLAAMMEGEPRLKCIFNKSNRGFAGGNNDGLKIASGDTLILLNSDCVVAGNWIEGLCAPLLKDPALGLTGPVSNSVGNEQKIFTNGTSRKEIIEEGLAWVSNSKGGWFETQMLNFFCVAMRRDVFDRVGMLDERFGLGFYEDDDYCARVRLAGYKLICIEDVFIYHRGGGSFGLLGSRTRDMMKKNRKVFQSKYLSPGRPLHPRDLQLHVIEGYLTQATEGFVNLQLAYRIRNRLRVIESRRPRGILKRWTFNQRFARLKELLHRYGVKLDKV